MVPQVLISLSPFTSQSRPVSAEEAASVSGGSGAPNLVLGAIPSPDSCMESLLGTSGVPLRRTGRTTAGHHSNPHRLPRAIEEGDLRAAVIPAPTSNRISILLGE